MNWQNVVYREGSQGVSLSIEPMFEVADIVYVPDAAAWSKTAPPWASGRRDEILARLKAPRWHRDLEWREGSDGGLSARLAPVPGSVESTPGGLEMLAQRLFDPGSKLTAAQARIIWHVVVRQFALSARGEVHLFGDGTIKGSVFEKVSLPALKENPDVKLVWHSASGQEKPASKPAALPESAGDRDLRVKDEELAKAIRERIQVYVRKAGVASRDWETIAAMAAIVGERCQELAGEFPVRTHTFVPGQRVFSDRVNVLLAGDGRTVDLDKLPTEAVYRQIKDQVPAGRYAKDRFPGLVSVFQEFAGRVGDPKDWGKVPLSLPAAEWPRLLPLRVAFDTRDGVDAVLAPIKDDKERALRVSTLALTMLLNDADQTLDARSTLLLVFETINGTAKTAPMIKPIATPTAAMREAQHKVIKVGKR